MVRVAAALLLVLVAAAPASAGPVTPPAGATYDTTDSAVHFRAEPDPQGRELALVFSREPDPSAAGSRVFLGLGTTLGVDMGWLAAKFDHIGTYYWWVCPVTGENFDSVIAECSDPRDFEVRFRLDSLSDAVAQSEAAYAMHRHLGGFWRGFSGRQVSCTRRARTRQRCRVSGFAGDSVLSGSIVIRVKRHRSWSLHRYKARIELLNEDCLLVDKQPRNECTTAKRKRGWVRLRRVSFGHEVSGQSSGLGTHLRGL